MDPKFFRQYADILREFGADNGPIGVAGRQPQPTAPAAATTAAAKPTPGQPNQPQTATTAPAPQQGVSRFANTADMYDQGIDGPSGERTTINTSTGQKQISNAGGTTTVDTTRGAVPVSQSTPNIGGYQQTTYTGSAGKGPASGAQTTSYSSGPLDVTRDTDAAGKQTSSSATYDMGVAKATASQQGDENAPVQTSMQYTQPVQEVGLPHGQDVHDTLDPKYPYYGPNTTTKEKLQYRLGQDERGAARARAGQQRSIHARNKPQLPEDVELQRLKEFLSKPY